MLVGQSVLGDHVDAAVVFAIEVLIHARQWKRANRFEDWQDAQPVDFGAAPWPREFPADSVSEGVLSFDQHHIETAAGQHPRQRRAGETASRYGDIEHTHVQRLSTVQTPPTIVARGFQSRNRSGFAVSGSSSRTNRSASLPGSSEPICFSRPSAYAPPIV